MQILELLQTLGDQSRQELMRRSVEVFTCTICQELMVTPFTVACGHTFCYECLGDWLQVKHTCPLCRARVRRAPVHNVPLKQLLDGFLDAIVRDHPDQKESITRTVQERSALYEADTNNGNGYFRKLFENYSEAVLDTSDGIPRCSVCHWEAHGSRCMNCGRRLLGANDDDDDDSDSDDDTRGDYNFSDETAQHDHDHHDEADFSYLSSDEPLSYAESPDGGEEVDRERLATFVTGFTMPYLIDRLFFSRSADEESMDSSDMDYVGSSEAGSRHEQIEEDRSEEGSDEGFQRWRARRGTRLLSSDSDNDE